MSNERGSAGDSSEPGDVLMRVIANLRLYAAHGLLLHPIHYKPIADELETALKQPRGSAGAASADIALAHSAFKDMPAIYVSGGAPPGIAPPSWEPGPHNVVEFDWPVAGSAGLRERLEQISHNLLGKAFPMTPHDEAEGCVTLSDVNAEFRAALARETAPATPREARLAAMLYRSLERLSLAIESCAKIGFQESSPTTNAHHASIWNDLNDAQKDAKLKLRHYQKLITAAALAPAPAAPETVSLQDKKENS